MHFVGVAEGPDIPGNFTSSREGMGNCSVQLYWEGNFAPLYLKKWKLRICLMAASVSPGFLPGGKMTPAHCRQICTGNLPVAFRSLIAEQGGSTFSADAKGSSKGKGGTTAGRSSNGAEAHQHFHCYLLPFISLSVCPWKSCTGACYQQSILGRWGEIVLRWKVLTVASITSLVKANRCPTHPLSRLNRRCN